MSFRALADLALYSSLATLPILLAWALYGLVDGDPRLPILYSGDAVFYLAMNKVMAETGWYLHGPNLGAPFGLEMYDFALPDVLNLLLIRTLVQASGDPVVGATLFFLLSFMLAALAAGVTARTLGLPRPVVFVIACLFALLPYHFHRGLLHLFLSNYFAIPIGVYLALSVWRPGGGGGASGS